MVTQSQSRIYQGSSLTQRPSKLVYIVQLMKVWALLEASVIWARDNCASSPLAYLSYSIYHITIVNIILRLLK